MEITTKTVHAEVKLKQGGQLHCIAPSSSGRRRLTKIICEVYKCTFGGCYIRFDNLYELTLLINEHKHR